MEVQSIHHVSLTASDLERSRRFYREVLGLEEIPRPDFDFRGAWFKLGPLQQLHLIVHEGATFRGQKGLDGRDLHFAVRVRSYRRALEELHAHGFHVDGDPMSSLRMRVTPNAITKFPQIHILDPDRHVIEINAEELD